jgi:hypothetical protein
MLARQYIHHPPTRNEGFRKPLRLQFSTTNCWVEARAQHPDTSLMILLRFHNKMPIAYP